jgi:hypothetical protein
VTTHVASCTAVLKQSLPYRLPRLPFTMQAVEGQPSPFFRMLARSIQDKEREDVL